MRLDINGEVTLFARCLGFDSVCWRRSKSGVESGPFWALAVDVWMDLYLVFLYSPSLLAM